MELRHLRYFISIVNAGSTAPADRRVHVSQPTLSRQIRDLEREFGVRLFDRICRRTVLTAEGQEMRVPEILTPPIPEILAGLRQ